MPESWIVNSDFSRNKLIDHLQSLEGYFTIEIKKGRTRTGQQNRALHVFLRQLSEALNDAGYDMKKALNEDVDIAWNETMAKEYLWRPIQKIVIQKQSTAEASSSDYAMVYEQLNRLIASKFGVHVPWPEGQK